MGQDMYLEAKRHLPPYDAGLAPVRQAIGRAMGYTPPKEKPGNDATLMEITDVIVRVGYWRKCDPLHQWFVSNVLESYDDCRAAYVSPEVLAELEERLDGVREDPERASEHFVSEGDEPMSESDIDYTRKVVVHAKTLQERGWDIYYRASG
jgi:DNA topoisomerase IA